LCGGGESTSSAEPPPRDAGPDATDEPKETVLDLDSACPLGMSASRVLQEVSSASRAVLTREVNGGQSTQTNLTVNISYSGEKIVFGDYQAPLCDASLQHCDRLQIPVGVHVRTDDGSFDDTWQAELFAFADDTRQVRSTAPLDLRQLNGTYSAETFIQRIYNSDASVDSFASVQAEIEITFRRGSSLGVITGNACRKLNQDSLNVSCKTSVIATWQSE
jgi:hypothetical protein